MRLLTISDPHGLEPLGCPVLAIPGNCDQRSILATLDASKAVNLDGAVHTIENVTFAGIGGSNPTPFDTPFERSEEEIGSMLEDLLIRADKGGGTIVLLTHAPPKNTLDRIPGGNAGSDALARPPKNTLDRIPGGNAGSDALARAIGKVDLIVCGHIHEDQGEMTQQGTEIVNVGQASQGQSAVITIDESIEVQFNNI
jgi:Icc-related predicted phosphoesterase